MPHSQKTVKEIAKEYGGAILIALALAFFVRGFIVEPFRVQGLSMSPLLVPGEYLFVEKITYRFQDPQPGDIVVIISPLNNKDKYIKRIVAGPGEKVKIERGGLYIWKKEKWEKIAPETSLPLKDRLFILGEGEYFVVGDNKENSLDSRVFGPIDRKRIVGRAFLSLWPPHKIGLFITGH